MRMMLCLWESGPRLILLNRILRCFNLASGLKVNLNKKKVFGIGVDNIDSQLPSILHCELASYFKYLGLLIGANVKLAKN